jgi:hypothetical protein
MKRYTIYRHYRADRDYPVASRSAESAVAALEGFARHCMIFDFSIDTDSAGRVVLCPAMGTTINHPRFYTYA